MHIRLILLTISISVFSFAASQGAIDDLEPIEVNGSQQWLLYRGESLEKPVVLFVHGGPGSPLMPFSRAFDGHFIKDFIVVHWDQRNSGKSYDPLVPMKTFTIDQVARDGIAVVKHLKEKFERSQVILVGHSWGSIVGAHMINLSPSDFSTYVSVGTVVNIRQADRVKYGGLAQRIEREGTAQDKLDLSELGPPPWRDLEKIMIQSRLMTKFGGSFYGLTGAEVDKALKLCQEYTESDWATLNPAMMKIWRQIEPYLSNYKAQRFVPSLDVRTIFVQGKFDLATPPRLAREYFEKVQAPQGKEWVDFNNSAHFPMYEEPMKFLETLKQAANH